MPLLSFHFFSATCAIFKLMLWVLVLFVFASFFLPPILRAYALPPVSRGLAVCCCLSATLRGIVRMIQDFGPLEFDR